MYLSTFESTSTKCFQTFFLLVGLLVFITLKVLVLKYFTMYLIWSQPGDYSGLGKVYLLVTDSQILLLRIYLTFISEQSDAATCLYSGKKDLTAEGDVAGSLVFFHLRPGVRHLPNVLILQHMQSSLKLLINISCINEQLWDCWLEIEKHELHSKDQVSLILIPGYIVLGLIWWKFSAHIWG